MAAIPETLLKRPLYIYNLPTEIIATLQLKSISALPTQSLETREEIQPPEHDGEDSKSSKPTSCARCNLTFASWQDQRNHFKSDLHGYNTKLCLRGASPVSEVEFEKLIGDLDESISGSESSESETDEDERNNHKGNTSMLNNLLKKQARIQDAPVDDISTKKRKRGSGKPPLVWFTSSQLSSNISLGIYRAVFTLKEQEDQENLPTVLTEKQLAPVTPGLPQNPRYGGVSLPKANVGPHIFLCMMGGGHFAAMIVALAPKISKKNGLDERQASVLAHKTFHRYTTRRKQGGAQSSNDAAKGAAHSAGSSLRRYNETALTDEIRALLSDWKTLIDSSELLFIRATGTTNRRTLFGPYDGQVLQNEDPRNRGFPFSTRRATQAELMRCFVELTRVKVSEVDEAALAAQAQAEEQSRLDAAKRKEEAAAQKASSKAEAAPLTTPEDDLAALHTTQLESLIKRSKAPALLAYLATNALSPDFQFHPLDSHAHHHAPTPLHLAASTNSAAVVAALLLKAGADPTQRNTDGKTAFEVAGDRATRDAFRVARAELGETRWAWGEGEGGAGVAEALSRAEAEQRTERERREESRLEGERRAAELRRLRDQDAAREEQRGERRLGKGVVLAGKEKTAEERREEEARGMTPEMKMRLERERRARAAEARMRRPQG